MPNPLVFEIKAKEVFQFLVDDYGFANPEVVNSKNEYRESIIYYKGTVAIEVLNAWHPSDYGFEVNYYCDRNLLQVTGDNIKTHEMLFYKLKEEQDMNLQFIEEGAQALKNYLISKHSG